MPLGGLGTGFVEIKPGGLMGEAGLLPGGPVIPTPHFRLELTTRGAGTSLLLADEATGAKPVSNKYFGHYPAADLDYGRVGALQVSIRATGQFVPSKGDLSNIPSATFRVRMKNISSRLVRAILKLEIDTQTARLLQPDSAATQSTSERLTIANGRGIQWKIVGTNSTMSLIGGGAGWSVESRASRDAEITLVHTLAAGEESSPTIVLSWHRPTLVGGTVQRLNHYASRFVDAAAAAAFAFKNANALDHANCLWQSTFYNSGQPGWISDGLINSLSMLCRNSIWTESDGFQLWQGVRSSFERPDWRYYGGLPMLLLFPELEKDAVLREVLSDPGDRKESCAKSVWRMLAVERVALVTQDAEFAKKVAPWLKKNLEQLASRVSADSPLLKDASDTEAFEGWKWPGASSYTNGIYAAVLAAADEVGTLASDSALSAMAKSKLSAVGSSFETEFWSNGTLRLYTDADQFTQNDNSFIDKLAGLADVNQLGFSWIGKSAQTRQALKKISETHTNQIRFGAISSVLPTGKPDDSGAAMTSEVSPYLVFHYIATTLYSVGNNRDDPTREVVLRLAESVCRGMQESGSVWSQPSIFASASGKPITGRDDLRNLAIWSIPLAMNGTSINGRGGK
ncbi:MAG: GH116 family glycosyl hydrolase [Chthonomonadales bacterium]